MGRCRLLALFALFAPLALAQVLSSTHAFQDCRTTAENVSRQRSFGCATQALERTFPFEFEVLESNTVVTFNVQDLSATPHFLYSPVNDSGCQLSAFCPTCPHTGLQLGPGPAISATSSTPHTSFSFEKISAGSQPCEFNVTIDQYNGTVTTIKSGHVFSEQALYNQSFFVLANQSFGQANGMLLVNITVQLGEAVIGPTAYLDIGYIPTPNVHRPGADCPLRPVKNEPNVYRGTCKVTSPAPGDWYIAIYHTRMPGVSVVVDVSALWSFSPVNCPVLQWDQEVNLSVTVPPMCWRIVCNPDKPVVEIIFYEFQGETIGLLGFGVAAHNEADAFCTFGAHKYTAACFDHCCQESAPNPCELVLVVQAPLDSYPPRTVQFRANHQGECHLTAQHCPVHTNWVH